MSAVPMKEESFTELTEIEYDSTCILPELILLTSLMLRTPQLFLFSFASSAEYKSSMRTERNIWLHPLIPNLIRGRRELLYTHFPLTSSLLPDVCASCLTAFPLTTSGRLRTRCYRCEEGENAIRDYSVLQQELATFWVPHVLFETLISQLIYKYYSPNGDKTWALML